MCLSLIHPSISAWCSTKQDLHWLSKLSVNWNISLVFVSFLFGGAQADFCNVKYELWLSERLENTETSLSEFCCISFIIRLNIFIYVKYNVLSVNSIYMICCEQNFVIFFFLFTLSYFLYKFDWFDLYLYPLCIAGFHNFSLNWINVLGLKSQVNLFGC